MVQLDRYLAVDRSCDVAGFEEDRDVKWSSSVVFVEKTASNFLQHCAPIF